MARVKRAKPSNRDSVSAQILCCVRATLFTLLVQHVSSVLSWRVCRGFTGT